MYGGYFPELDYIKIDKDNTIKIKKLKDSWNREEVVYLLHNILDISLFYTKEEIDNWIKENL